MNLTAIKRLVLLACIATWFVSCIQNSELRFEDRRQDYEQIIQCLLNDSSISDRVKNGESVFINSSIYIKNKYFPLCVDTKKIISYDVDCINVCSMDCIVFLEKPKGLLKKEVARFLFARTQIAKERYLQTLPGNIKFYKQIDDYWSEYREIQSLAN